MKIIKGKKECVLSTAELTHQI